MLVLLATVVITTTVSLLFGYCYMRANKIPTELGAAGTDVIVLRGGSVLHASRDLSRVQIQEILMNDDVGENTYPIGKVTYSVDVDRFQAEDDYEVIKLTPLLRTSGFVNVMLGFIIIVFFVTFLAASLIVQRSHVRNFIGPITKLKRETELLSAGELDTAVVDEGEAEVLELCRAVEQLRLKLKESIYYQEKYDDNRKFLISSISHDLRTPVTAIRGYVEGVLDGVATGEKRERYLKAALEKTTLISAMIDDLLLYSKLDLHQIPFDMERVDIAAYLEDSIADNAVAFEKEGKRLTLESELPGPVQVSMDAVRFRRVVQNVLDNARKHIAPETGRVVLRLRETNSSVIIECRDNGIGIPKEDLPHIFDRFYRADNARKVEGSSGLGLAIAKQIVEGMDGRIWAVSQVGEGTSMMISLKKVK